MDTKTYRFSIIIEKDEKGILPVVPNYKGVTAREILMKKLLKTSKMLLDYILKTV